MAKQQESLSYLLIAGLPRSGSTLLQCVLSKCPETYTLPESHFFEESKKINPTNHLSVDQVKQLLQILKTKWQLNTDGLVSKLDHRQSESQVDIRDVYFQLIDQYRPSDNRSRLLGVEKTPGNLNSVESLIEHRKDIKVILTCRNPRDFANSMSQQYWAPDSLSKITQMWNQSMRLMTKLTHKFSDNVKMVSYEEMVSQPEQTFSSIYEFARINWDMNYLQNLNSNSDEFILPLESQWKNKNINSTGIVNEDIKLVLNFKQRLTVHVNNFLTAVRLGQLQYYKF